MPIKVSEGLLESLELGELSTQRIRTGAEHSIWQARQKRCAPALGVTPVWSMWIFNAVQLFLFFLSVSASFTSMVAIWVERRGEMRLGCSFSSHLFACVLREICVAPDPSGFVVQQQVHSDLDNLQAPVS